jgi:ArsR family transcriptional regulator
MAEFSKSSAFIQSEISFDRALKVLSDPTRLEILRLLGNSGDLCCGTVPMDTAISRVGLCVQDLVIHMQLPQSTVSHHLGMLRNIGLVYTHKNRACVYYMRNEDAINAVKRALNAL